MTNFEQYLAGNVLNESKLNEGLKTKDILKKSNVKPQKEVLFNKVKNGSKYILIVTDKSDGDITSYMCSGKEAIVITCNILWDYYSESDYEELYDEHDGMDIQDIIAEELNTDSHPVDISLFKA